MQHKIFHVWKHTLADELINMKNGGGLNINSIVNNNVIVCHPHNVQPSSHMTNKQSTMNNNNSQRKQLDTSPSITINKDPHPTIYNTSPTITENSVWINQQGAFNNMNQMNCTPPAKNRFETLFDKHDNDTVSPIIETTMVAKDNDKQEVDATPTLQTINIIDKGKKNISNVVTEIFQPLSEADEASKAKGKPSNLINIVLPNTTKKSK